MARMDDDLFVKVVLKFKVYRPGTGKNAWFKDRAHLSAAVEAIADLPFFADLQFGGAEDAVKPVRDVATAQKLVALGADDPSSLRERDGDDPDLLVRFAPMDDTLNVRMWSGRRSLAKHRETIVDQLTDAAIAIRNALRDVAGLAVGYGYAVHESEGEFAYPRPRPPITHAVFPVGSIVTLIDHAYHASKAEDADPDLARSLDATPSEAPARRARANDLTVIRWVRDATEAELQRGAAAHERWLTATTTAEVELGYNERGDQLEERGRTVAKAPLTLYAPATKIGYKAVVVFPDGTIEPHAWNQAKMVLKDRALKDGTKVAEVKLVVPLRDLVFTVAAEAKKAGFSGVLYPADDGSFWNPDPPGNWADPPMGAESAKPSKPRAKKPKAR